MHHPLIGDAKEISRRLFLCPSTTAPLAATRPPSDETADRANCLISVKIAAPRFAGSERQAIASVELGHGPRRVSMDFCILDADATLIALCA
jgi:hypothetical protein